MRTHPLIYVNTAVIAALIAGAVFLYVRERRSGRDLLDPAGSQGPSTAAGSRAGGTDEALRRVEALETRLSELSRRFEGGPAPARKEGGKDDRKVAHLRGAPGELVEPLPEGGEKGKGPVSRSEVRALVRKELDRERKRREDEAKKKAEDQRKKAKKPRLTVADFSRQMGLDAAQETELRNTVRSLHREVVKILFDVKEDGDLEGLKQQLKQAEYDPELKAKLKEQAGINYLTHQQDFMVLFVKAHTHLGKVLTPEQRKAVDRYNLQLSQPEFPDLEAWFAEDEGEKKD